MSLATLPEPVIETASPTRVAAHRVRRLAARPELQEIALSLGDQALVSGTNLLTSVFIGRSAGVAGLGLYSLALSAVLLSRGIQEQLVTAPFAVRSQSKGSRGVALFLGSVLVHHAICSLVTVIALLGLMVALRLGYGPAGLKPVIGVLTLVTPVLLFREFLRQIAFAQLRPRIACSLDLAVAIVQIGGLALLAWNGWLTVGTALGTMAAGCLAAAAAWLVFRPFALRIAPRRIWKDWQRNWGFGRWALASQLINGAGLSLMPWIVAAVDGPAETGLLAAGGTIVGVANMFVLGMANYLTPKAARAYVIGGVSALSAVLRTMAILFTITLGGLAFAAAVAGDLAAGMVYGEEFAAAGLVVAVLSLGMWTNAMAITAGNGLWAIGRPEANFRADVVSLVATAVATILLVPAFGAVGGAGALLAGGTAAVGVRTVILRRILHEKVALSLAGGV